MKKKERITIVILIVLFISGLSLLLYPTVANFINTKNQSRAIVEYAEQAEEISEEEYAKYLKEAEEYNARILQRENLFAPSDEDEKLYPSLLNLTDRGIMGYVEIPAIDIRLPIYHGTSDSVLAIAVGHLPWSSLPVGGDSTHCVISGHRGLPSADLFTHLDKLVVGDVFMINVLNEQLTYEVDQILIVEPQDSEALQVVEGQDYCTLLTCTPYGINTQRLLVRGHRIESEGKPKTVTITSEAMQVEPMVSAAVVGVPVLIILMIVEIIRSNITVKSSVKKEEENE